jgi:hypothetical protein
MMLALRLGRNSDATDCATWKITTPMRSFQWGFR